jgi:hypothetical protein
MSAAFLHPGASTPGESKNRKINSKKSQKIQKILWWKMVLEEMFMLIFEKMGHPEEHLAKKTNPLLLTKALFIHYFGMNLSFVPRAPLMSEKSQILHEHLIQKHLPPSKNLEFFKLFLNVFSKIS